MPPVLRRLRQQMPYLTPGFFPDDEDDLAVRLPRLQPPSDEADIDKIWRLGAPTATPLTREQVPALNRPVLVPPPESSAMLPPPVADNFTVGPPRVTDQQLAEIGAPPMVLRRDGRPINRYIGEGTQEERLGVRRRALEEYQPQKESKKRLALRTILNFVGGGIPGAAQTLIGPGGVMDRRGVDRQWQREQLGQVYGQLDRTRADRRAGLQEDLLESQVRENQAQADRLRNPPPLKPDLIEIPDPANPNRNIWVPKREGLTYEPRTKPPPLQRPQTGKMRGRDDRTYQTEYDPEIKRWKQSLDADGQPIVIDDVKDGKPDTSTSQREALQANITEATNERERIGKTLTTMPRTLPGPIVGQDIPNPDYVDLMRRYRALDDDVRKWRVELGKVPAVTTRTSTGFNRKGQSMSRASLPEAAKRMGVSVEEAEAQLKREGVTFH